MPIKFIAKIKLPCKARELEDAIRNACEQHGCYDTAVVSFACYNDPQSWESTNFVILSTPESE